MAAIAAESRTAFGIEGMHCSNCATSVERALRSLDGVHAISVNAATGKARVDWDPAKLTLRPIFATIRKLGFRPVPLAGEAAEAAAVLERRQALKRIGVAGLGMMQTMMFVYALYASGAHGIDPTIAKYLQIAGMLLTTPVLLYSGMPFYQAALHDLKRRRVGMDVPVAVALTVAFTASVYHTLLGAGEVYYDSVTMFIFLLSLGRFAEMSVRQRSLSASEALARTVPAEATRVLPSGAIEKVPLARVVPGDRLRVPKGAAVPVDGQLACATASLDESLITGESRPVARSAGDAVPGGAINAGNAIEIVCAKSAAQSTLAGIIELLQLASSEKPRTVAVADRVASWFSMVTLALALAVAVFWSVFDPQRAMQATLAVLVVTCPCALSLAIPATFAAATSYLARQGLLVVKPDALERLSRIDSVLLDKTGTLTEGAPVATVMSTTGIMPERALAIAAALERGSDHPLARAFQTFADPAITAVDFHEHPGAGIEGIVQGRRWRLGTREFACGHPDPQGDSLLYLESPEGAGAATLSIRDRVVAEAVNTIHELQQRGLKVIIASGDTPEAVSTVAAALGIQEYHARMTPQNKLDFIEQTQKNGHGVLMVGDGINDAPVLAAATVSCAMTQGSAIAQAAADLLMLNGSLKALVIGLEAARHARRIVRQNLVWAVGYNLVCVPLAAAGLIAPWVAALGMSISSLAVVTNAARLAWSRAPRSPQVST
jgi:P-type Cu2+ transporter